MANLERQIGVTIWDRTTKVAKLTDEGQAILGAARRVLAEVDALRILAADMVAGLEASVSLCVDALFPLQALLDLCAAFAKEFPSVDLRVDTQVMSAVSARVLAGGATLGVVSAAGLAAGLEREPLGTIRMVPVVSHQHPLARFERERIPNRALSDATQIVLSERRDDGVPDQAVLSPRTWRVADLHTKHMMLRAGLGWGNLPESVVRDDLVNGALVLIRPASWTDDEHVLPLYAVYRSDRVLGPAHRWLFKALETFCARDTANVKAGSKTDGTSKTETKR
jgi:DNA-binding transcriptional LysR family regulator